MLENAFRSGSILELSKEFALYSSYLQFVSVICDNEYLVPILLPIGDLYEPKQIDPVFKLLAGLNDLAKIFLQAIDKDKGDEESEKPKTLAREIVEINDKVSKTI
jgi:hypothetical protein